MKWTIAILLVAVAANARADMNTIGSNGIKSDSLGLTGAGISIGQVEIQRPGDPDIDDDGIKLEAGVDDDGAHSSFTTNPKAVFIENGIAPTPNAGNEIFNENGPPPLSHATEVASVMISSDALTKGVSTGASLYSSGVTASTGSNNSFIEYALAGQEVALRDSGKVRAINMSFEIPVEPAGPMQSGAMNGQSTLTQFVDWSADRDDVLYVTAGDETLALAGPKQPLDNFNGLKVGASEIPDGETAYRKVASFNRLAPMPVDSNRTFIDIIAPGNQLMAAEVGGGRTENLFGTSFAAPHAVGTIALLQQHAENRIMAAAPRWNDDARHHEVMKAVLMNSADKIKDDGTFVPTGESEPIPVGQLLGMQSTVLKKASTPSNPITWLDSMAYGDGLFDDLPGEGRPLDEEMGTGQLNASRAFTQFATGEWNGEAGDIPAIGWDWGTTMGEGDNNLYQFADELVAGSFISITLTWDRSVTFQNDQGTPNRFDATDSFADYIQAGPLDPPADSVINDLAIFLVSRDDNETIAASEFNEGTVEHLFFRIPSTGHYDFQVRQEDADVGVNQDYAVAWWSRSTSLVSQGDFNNDGTVDAADLSQWKGDFGQNEDSDADGDGDSDGSDFTVWQRNLGATIATPVGAPVPEPAAWILIVGGLPLIRRGRTA